MFANVAFCMADMLPETSDGQCHSNVRDSQILRSEKCAPKACDAIQSFMNPFTVEEKDGIFCLL